MANYKQLVLEKTNTTIHNEHGGDFYDISFEVMQTGDGYNMYVILDQSDWVNVEPDRDIYYEAYSMQCQLENAIELGGKFYVDDEILDACDLHEDSERWEYLYNRWFVETKMSPKF